MSDDVKIPLPQSLQEIVGSLLFASESPLTEGELRAAVRAVEAEAGENKEIMDVYRTCTAKEIDQALRGLEKALDVAGAGFRLVCTGGAYRLQTTPSCGRYVRAMLKLDRPNRLGRASLETLAIVAYRQPLTKAEIEEIRGVDVSGNIKTLTDLQLIRLVGKSELPGHPFLYGTTPLFLEHFGLASLQDLNDLDPTLQRSNPKKKAEAYRKKVAEKPEEAEKPGAAAGGSADAGGDTADAPSAGGARTGLGLVEDGSAQEEPMPEAEPGVVGEEIGVEEDEDDFFIDDAPDEFDDEDDDEDDDDEEAEDDDGEDNAEGDGAAGAGGPDGV